MENHKASIVLVPLHTNLVNLPSRLGNLLANANIKVQDVIVEIVHKGSKSYVGWSGWNSSSINTLEIDSILAQSLKVMENESVTLNLKVNNFETRQVNLEPLTSSDWELVELHAQTLEDKLLSQSRCVSLNQILVVYPSQTTSAKLIVTDIGSTAHNYAKLSPECEVAIAPKPRVKKAAGSSRSAKSSRSGRPVDDYSYLPSVLKRAIPLPHKLYSELPGHSNSDGYEVYANSAEIIPALNRPEYVAVSIIPGPNAKQNKAPRSSEKKDKDKEKDKKVSLDENKRIIAKLVNYPGTPINTVGLSRKLAVALSVDHQIGSIVSLKPSIKPTLKEPSAFTIHPYITQTKKNNQVDINSNEKKEKSSSLTKALDAILLQGEGGLADCCITNFSKIPIIPGVLPNGGLLKFRRNDDPNAWVKPSATKKLKIEVGEDLLRGASFLESAEETEELETPVGFDKVFAGTLDSITVDSNSGVLLHGNSGSGKTLALKTLARTLSQDYGFHVKYVACETIMNENFNSLSANHILKWVQECSWYKPSVLILDNMEKVFGAEVEHGDSSTAKNLTELLVAQVHKLHAQPNSNFSLIGSSASKEAANGYLFSSHLIENFHTLSPPDKVTRASFLQSYFTDSLGCSIGFDIMDMVSETEGYLPNDLKTLSDRVYHEALFNNVQEVLDNQVAVTKQDLEKALKGYTPSNLRGVKLQKSSINWSDIGGLKEAKNILLETLEWPTKYAPIFANCPLRLRSGILLYGFPGCGKTLLASAVAGQCGLNFISIKGPEILNKYIGASEQSVRELFERAQSAKPCILFFDEFDSIAPKRGHDSTGVTDRVVNQMLTQMDGAEGLDGVYVLAATSRPDLIDSALLRPGRLDKSVICDMPSFDDRLDILQSITTKMDLTDDVDLNVIAERTGGFSGADMQGLAYNAYLKAVHVKLSQDEALAASGKQTNDKRTVDFFKVQSEKLNNAKMRPADRVKILQQIEKLFEDKNEHPTGSSDVDEGDSNPVVEITQADFLASLEETKPSISVKERTKLEGIYSQFVDGRDGNMPDGSASNEVGARSTLM